MGEGVISERGSDTIEGLYLPQIISVRLIERPGRQRTIYDLIVLQKPPNYLQTPSNCRQIPRVPRNRERPQQFESGFGREQWEDNEQHTREVSLTVGSLPLSE